jgi:hypothetical protein
MLKSMAENARAENRDNFFVQLLVSCFEFLLTVSKGRQQQTFVGMHIAVQGLVALHC